MTKLSIYFEDEDLIAVDKPAGLLVHRSHETSMREEALLQILRDQLGQRLYPVHRLDRATSGLLLLGKNTKAAAFLSQQFRQQQVGKRYLAVARGWLPDQQLIETALRDLDCPKGELQEAQTWCRLLAHGLLPIAVDGYPEARYSLLLLSPATGRRHQLRRHLKQVHHPLIGDTVYGKGKHNLLFRELWQCHRLLLHHWSARWYDRSGKLCEARAPLDETWHRVLLGLSWQQELAAADPWQT